MANRPIVASGLPAPGDRIAEKYDVIRVIGEGGMGVVYEVVHTRLQQRAAIKMLQPRVQAMPDVASRFEREARAACRLKSRHAVRITDVDHDEKGRAYMVMEFLEGFDLSEDLQSRGRLPPREAVDTVLQTCTAMAEAHASGVIHRDLKPSNLFLVREGGERIVKVLDFGISKLTTEGEAAVTSTFATMGTPLYMSPEQIRSAKNVDARTDIWSLGVILYEALAGDRPFQGTTTAAAAAIVADEPVPLSTIVPNLPEGLDVVVMKALAKKPEDRYADVRALAEALAPFGSSRAMFTPVDAPSTPLLRSAAPRAQSTPSFVHAETLAQTPPPPVAHASGGGLLSQARTGPTAPAPLTPSTEASWATQGRGTSGGGKKKLAAAAAAGVLVLGVAAVAVVRMGSKPGSAAAPASTDSPSAPATAASIPASPAVTVSAPAQATPTTTSSSTSAASAPSTQPPAPPPRSAKPHAPHAHPVSSPSSPSPSPSPAPATTNPLHL